MSNLIMKALEQNLKYFHVFQNTSIFPTTVRIIRYENKIFNESKKVCEESFWCRSPYIDVCSSRMPFEESSGDSAIFLNIKVFP